MGNKTGKVINISKGNMKNDFENMLPSDEYDDLGLLMFEKKKVNKWKEKNIQNFLLAIEFPELQEKFKENITTGRQLLDLSMDNDVFSELSTEKKNLFSIYLRHINECVEPSRKTDKPVNFTLGFHRVLKKLIGGGAVGLSDKKFPLKRVESHCSILSNAEKIARYLLVKKDIGEDDGKIKIKLIITENTFDPKEQMLRKIISPIINYIPKFKQKFGMFHSAILVGSFYLQWTDTAIIIPKKVLSSGSAIVSIDTNPLTVETGNDFDEIRESLGKIIAKWNCSYKYCQYKKEKREGNCQDFVLDVCRELEIDLKIEDSVFSDYLDKIRKKGAFKIQFKPNDDFVEAFKLKEFKEFEKWERSKKDNKVKINFDTHRQLDDFLYHCYIHNPFAVTGEKFKSEYRLLKSFDRAFWLRHLKFSKDEKYKPSPADKNRRFGVQENFVCGCVFSDPRSTGSYC